MQRTDNYLPTSVVSLPPISQAECMQRYVLVTGVPLQIGAMDDDEFETFVRETLQACYKRRQDYIRVMVDLHRGVTFWDPIARWGLAIFAEAPKKQEVA